MLVIDVLVTASAATAEIGTRCHDAVRGWFEDFDQFRFRELFLLAGDSGGDAFAIDGEGNEDSFATIARDAFASESDVMDR